MSALHGIHHVAIVTRDLDAFLAFYGDVFGAEVVADLTEDDQRHALVDVGGGALLHPFEQPDNPNASGVEEMFVRGHLDHVALAVPEEERFEELRRRLVEVGASDGTVTDFGLVRSIHFRDPDGHHVELARTVPGVPARTFDQRGIERFAG